MVMVLPWPARPCPHPALAGTAVCPYPWTHQPGRGLPSYSFARGRGKVCCPHPFPQPTLGVGLELRLGSWMLAGMGATELRPKSRSKLASDIPCPVETTLEKLVGGCGSGPPNSPSIKSEQAAGA